MARRYTDSDLCEIEALVLHALAHKSVEKSVLSEDDVRSVLQDAVSGLPIMVPGSLGTKAANDVIIEGS